MSTDRHSSECSPFARWFASLNLGSINNRASRRRILHRSSVAAGLECLEDRLLLTVANGKRARNDLADIVADATPNLLRANVFDNDTVTSGSKLKVTAITNGAGLKRSVPKGATGKEIVGEFGTLKIYANGRFIYRMNQNSAVIAQLAAGEKLIDLFEYNAKNNRPGVVRAKLRIRIRGVNEPRVVSAGAVDVPENTTDVVDVNAFDPKGETENGGGLTYAITGGADAALFSIDANTGALEFDAAPDFENPADGGTDNVYNVQVTVTNSSGKTGVKDIKVTVTDLDPEGIKIIAGGGADVTPTDGETATNLDLGTIRDITVDDDGNVYFIDDTLHRLLRVNTNGTITVIAGGGSDAGPSTGDTATDLNLLENAPRGLAVDGAGNVYYTYRDVNVVIRVNAVDGKITVLAGQGNDNSPDDGDTATALDLGLPEYMAVDQAGNVYFTDIILNLVIRINAVDGKIKVIAGGGADSSPNDGDKATDLNLNNLGDIAVDSAGNVFFENASDGGGGLFRVNVADGTITRIAGGGSDGAPSPSDGVQATALNPSSINGIAVDGAGNVLFNYFNADSGQGQLLRVLSDGTIKVLAGGGADGTPDDGDTATDLLLANPFGVAVDGAGNVYFSELNSGLIVRIPVPVDA